MEVGIFNESIFKGSNAWGIARKRRGGREGGYWSLDLSDALKPNYESERGKFLIDFSSFFLIVAQQQYSITFPYYVKKKERKNFIHKEI